MANTRPFTYNPGGPIEGQQQKGDLAYGFLEDVNEGPNYSGNPGGRKWWMGPDEDNKYIIGKDVPTMNHPTQVPEGDIGSVRFWSSLKNDAAFKERVNTLPARVGQTPFTTVFQCVSWLDSNGYFHNYPVSEGGLAFAEFSIITLPVNKDQQYAVTASEYQKYNSTTDDLYVTPAISAVNGVGPVIIENVNTITSGSSYLYNQPGDYLPTTQSQNEASINGAGYGYFDLDESNNKMYMIGANGFLVKYNLTNETIDSWKRNQSHTFRAQGVHDSNSGQFITMDDRKLRFYDDGDLSLNRDFRYTGSNLELQDAYVIALDTTNNRICTAGREKFAILNPTNYSLIHTGSWSLNGPPGYIFNNDYNITNGIYNATEGKYYFGAQGSDTYPKIISIDDTTYEVEYISLQQISGISLETKCNIAYDADRNAIWSMDGRRKLIAIDCSTNTIKLHTDITLQGAETSIMDTVANDKLYIGNTGNNGGIMKAYNVNLVWPI